MVGKTRHKGVLIVLAVFVAVLLSLLFIRTDGFGLNDAEDSNSARSTTVAQDDRVNPADQVSDASQKQGEQAGGNKDSSDKDSSAPQKKSPDEVAADHGAESTVSGGPPEDDDLEAELTISGTVLDDAGQLVEGATVIAAAGKNPGQEENGPETAAGQFSKVTDHLGGFNFIDLEEGEYNLTASKGEEYFPARMRVRTGMANAELTLQRVSPIRVFGTVSDEEGEPLEKVTVRALGTKNTVESDLNGAYEIETAPTRAGEPSVLGFRLVGYKETRRRVEVAPDSDHEEVQLDVQMEADSNGPKVAVTGQVLGPVGGAVAGVGVRLKAFSRKGYSARTDESGEFSIPAVEVGEGYRLNIEPSEDYEGYQSEDISLGPEDAFFEIELDSAKFSSLSGTVMDLYGRPLSGFQLWLRGVGTSAQSQLPVRTDEAGRFRLEQLRAGEVALETRSLPMLRASSLVLEAGEHRDVDIPLDWGTEWLLGRVVDAQGQPVSGANITISWNEQLRELVSESRRDLRSDLEGYFAASNLGAEHYTVTVRAPGYRTFHGKHEIGSGAEELVIQLQ